LRTDELLGPGDTRTYGYLPRSAEAGSTVIPAGTRLATCGAGGYGNAPHGARLSRHRVDRRAARIHHDRRGVVRHREVHGGPLPCALHRLSSHWPDGGTEDHRLTGHDFQRPDTMGGLVRGILH